MDSEHDVNSSLPRAPGDDESRSAVNSLILDYYKKFGRKRDLEQYFSLSTAQSDIRDPSSIFWARMKADNESSDSGERSDKKSDSSQELCRISIRFPAQDPCITQESDSKSKTESTSPPIIIEELPQDSKHNSEDEATKSDDEAAKSDDNSQKSYDIHLDTSLNKLHSPSSSITSQRRLEWDSLADVGYANESERKTSASSLSTLERLALKQQYSNNDTQQNSNLGVPTAHSTPLDENEAKSKGKKGIGKRSTKIYKKDVDVVEVNVPHSSNMNPAPSINVNLTKHISFNVEKDGKVTIDNVLRDISVSPEKVSVETEAPAVCQRTDREMQTSLTKSTYISSNIPDNVAQEKIPILISLNTLRSRARRRRLRMAKRKLKTKKRGKENIPVQEKSGEQLSEAESFEYMPGHIYNQNQITANSRQPNTAPSNVADNKSSLESSGVTTSDSSKDSKHSFTKDLEKSIDILKSALKQRCDDSSIRKELIKQVCQRLLDSKYRDDDSTTDFLSGLSFSSKKLGLGEGNNTTTSTSDANNSAEKSKRPKKSILRTDKFNPGSIASTSQSAPNLPVASKSDNLVSSNLAKNLSTSNTESESSKEKNSSDNGLKLPSEELYKKYLQAVKREEAYKKHLKDKEMFLKQKLVGSDSALKVPEKVDSKQSDRLKDLINDLTRNNYDDGSGDASKLEGSPSCHRDFDRLLPNRTQRSHSVFTLSSGMSDGHNKKPNLKKKLQSDVKDLSKPGPSKDSHYCCCPHHGNLKFADSSVQVNIKNQCSDETCPAKHVEQQKLEPPKRSAKIISDNVSGNLRYVCLCSKNVIQEAPDDFLIYKCSRLNSKGVQLEESTSKSSNEVYVQCNNETCVKRNLVCLPSPVQVLNKKSSQTNMLIKMLYEQPTDSLICRGDQMHVQQKGNVDDVTPLKSTTVINEATRCIQTEISINPKISEPTLSDINIVSDINCAKCVSEHCREIVKSSVTDLLSNQAVASTSAFSDSCKSTGTSKDIGKKIKSHDVVETNRKDIIIQEPNIEQSENYTIPIHGTNMTLMVSIGSERKAFPIGNTKEVVAECIGTDKVNAIEQATSLREECSKGVQSDKNSMNTEIIDHNSNKIGDSFDRYHCKPLTVNTSVTAEEIRFGTYPQTSTVIGRKPLRRANTDTDKVQSALNTRNIGAAENNIQPKSSVKTDGNSGYNLNQEDACPCGCNGKKQNCQLDCIECKMAQNINLSHTKDISTQDTTNDKCSCGCGGSIDACKADCPERKSAPSTKRQSQIQASCGPKSSSEISIDAQGEKCPCSCGGTKNMCSKTCKELSNKKQCGTQSIEQISTQTDNSLEYSNKCSCGCGGEKKLCKKSCKERNSSPRIENSDIKLRGTQLTDIQTNTELLRMGQCLQQPKDKESCTQTNTLSQQEKCPCGCGGTKDRCQKCELSSINENRKRNKKQTDTQTDSRLTQMGQCEKQPFDECVKQSLHKMIDTETNDSLTKREKGGKEITKHCGTQSNNKTRMPLNHIEKCFCGCGGTKDNCQKDCTELKSPREQLPLEERKQRSKEIRPVLREFNIQTDKKEIGTQKNRDESPQSFTRRKQETDPKPSTSHNANDHNTDSIEKFVFRSSDKSKKSSSETEPADSGSDPILNLIQNITKKYTKTEVEKNKRKKCFKEIMTVLNYLLDTDEAPDAREVLRNSCESTTTTDETDTSVCKKVSEKNFNEKVSRKLVDKGVQPSSKPKSNPCVADSSEVLTSIDIPGTSTDSAACKVLNKIKKECEKYHQKRCKIHSGKKCDCTSSTSVNCDKCRRVHHCQCRTHKCKYHKKSSEKMQKNPIAYNLILQTSESVMSEGPSTCEQTRTLKNIIVKVPKKKPLSCMPFREVAAKFEKQMSGGTPKGRGCRSKSLPNDSEISSIEEIIRRSQGATVREYLEKNRPDFIENCTQRQSCMRYISESRANERAAKRELLSVHLAQLPDVTELDSAELNELAAELGSYLRSRKQPAPKFMSEREMKKHSEKICKSLPEAVQKREEKRKENMKKTNLLMANMFKRNLQKKTLCGSVNLSNYSFVIKI